MNIVSVEFEDLNYHDHIQEDRLSNWIKSMLLLLGIFILLGLMGSSLLGVQGLILAPMVIISVLVFEYATPREWMLRIHRAEPVPRDLPLYRLFEELCHRLNLDGQVDLYYSRVNMLNALTLGTGSRATIVLTLPLLETFTVSEVEGVIAHELSHVKNRDLRFMSIAQVATRMVSDLSTLVIFAAFILVPLSLLTGSPHLPLLSVMLAIVSPYLAILMQMKLSRTREFAADLGAVEAIRNPDGLISALLKLEAMQLNMGLFGLFRRRTHPLHSHPETRERVERLNSYGPKQKIINRWV